jgi:hypothetical protein
MLWYVKRMPRPAAVAVWTAGAVTLHAIVPFELSRWDDSTGRSQLAAPRHCRPLNARRATVAGAAGRRSLAPRGALWFVLLPDLSESWCLGAVERCGEYLCSCQRCGRRSRLDS